MDVREEAHRRGELTRPRVSSRADVARLLADLHGEDASARLAAVARLRVIGSRATTALAAVIDSEVAPVTRAAAVSALEGLDDPRAIDLALQALQNTDEGVAVAALSVLKDWVTREQGTRVLEALTVAALDKSRSGAVRLAAFDALSDLPRSLVEPLRAGAATAATEGPLDDPTAVRDWLARQETTASLSALHDALVHAGERERIAAEDVERRGWTGVRGALHVALAQRSSRVALYDLREAFERTHTPLPLDFVIAITRIGDATCLESLARAWATSLGEPWWRARLAESAADLVRRIGLSGRHAALRRVRAKWPGFV